MKINTPHNQYFYHFSYFATGEGSTIHMGIVYGESEEIARDKVKKRAELTEYFNDDLILLKAISRNKNKIKECLDQLFNDKIVKYFLSDHGYLFNGCGEFHFSSHVNFG